MKHVFKFALIALLLISLIGVGSAIPANQTVHPSLATYLTMNGTVGSTTFLDSNSPPKTFAATGTPISVSAASKFGSGSLKTTNPGGYLNDTTKADFAFMHQVGTVGNWSFTGWYNISTLNAQGDYIFSSMVADQASTGAVIRFADSRRAFLYIGNGGGVDLVEYAYTDANTTPVPDNNWHYLVVTYDQAPATNNTKFYVDGSLIGQATKTAQTPSTGASSSTPKLFSNYDGTIQMGGSFDDLVIYNGVVIDGTIVPTREVLTNPQAGFSTNVTTGSAPLPIQFTDATLGNTPTAYSWRVTNVTGNNTELAAFSTSASPQYTLPYGNWTINHTVTNIFGTSLAYAWMNVSAAVSPPTVIFATNVTSGVNPLALYLNDTSTGSPTYWNTSWGDSGWTNQTTFPITNITHAYSTAGSYWINEYATNAYGTANGTPLLITVYGFANSQFASFNTLGGAPFTTYLYDTSTNTTGGTNSWYWKLGDGNVSTAQNLYYTWNITGTYSVNHSFSNTLSTSWQNKSNYITVGTSVTAPVASFNGTPSLGANPLTEFFVDLSANTPTSWNWSFGDGYVSDEQNPQHTYTNSGFFTVNFSATNVAGTGWMNRTNFVVVY